MGEPTSTRPGLAALLQLTDSALPIGRYVQSHGLESWLAAHPAATVDELADLVWSAVEAVATLDAVVLRMAMAQTDLSAVIDLDLALYRAKPAAQARMASQSCGRHLAALGAALGAHDDVTDAYLAAVGACGSPGNLAVVEGRVLASAGVDAADVVTAVVTGSAGALLTSAVRLGRLGPRAAQLILWQGHTRIARLTATSLAIGIDDMHSSAVELEIHLMRHDRRTGNLFRT